MGRSVKKPCRFSATTVVGVRRGRIKGGGVQVMAICGCNIHSGGEQGTPVAENIYGFRMPTLSLPVTKSGRVLFINGTTSSVCPSIRLSVFPGFVPVFSEPLSLL